MVRNRLNAHTQVNIVEYMNKEYDDCIVQCTVQTICSCIQEIISRVLYYNPILIITMVDVHVTLVLD